MWLETYCEDLKHTTDAELADACRRWRMNAANKFFPTPGQLLDAGRNPFADPPTGNKHDWHSRLGFGGPDCKCAKCVNKIPRAGFFKAPLENYARDEATRAEIDRSFQSQVPPSRLDEDEMHTRFLMTQELVRDHGWEWENARAKVMFERTRALYPEFRFWPDAQTKGQ